MKEVYQTKTCPSPVCPAGLDPASHPAVGTQRVALSSMGLRVKARKDTRDADTPSFE